MREYINRSVNIRTLDGKPRTSKQASFTEILQGRNNGTLGVRPLQRKNTKEESLQLFSNNTLGKIIQRNGDGKVPDNFCESVRPLMLDALRIENRMYELDKILANAPMKTFFSREHLQTIFEIKSRKKTLVDKWEKYSGPRSADLTRDTEIMDQIFWQFIPIWNFHYPHAKNAYKEFIINDGRIVKDRNLWCYILSNENTFKKAKEEFTIYITEQINLWRTPKLSKWYNEVGFPAASSYIRIDKIEKIKDCAAHLTLYIANVNDTVSITDNTNIIMDALFPASKGNHMGIHITVEIFNEKDSRNPHYFKGEGYYASNDQAITNWLASKTLTKDALLSAMSESLQNKLDEYHRKINRFKQERSRDIS